MLNTNYEEEVLKILRTLDDEKKREVLEIVKGFSKRPKTVSGKEFLENTQHIRISDDDATEMMQAIEGELGQTIIEDSAKLKFDQTSLKKMEKAIQEIDNPNT